MKTFVALILLIAPWPIFGSIVMSLGQPSAVGLVITLVVSAFGLTLLITKKN